MFPNFQYTTNNKQNNPYTSYNNQYQYNQYNQYPPNLYPLVVCIILTVLGILLHF